MKAFKVEISDPRMEVKRGYIEFVSHVTVTEGTEVESFKYSSYESIEDVMKKVEKHRDEILKGYANVEAWLAAEGKVL